MTRASDGGAILRPGAVTSIGSLPHTDADAAAAFVLRAHPELPAAPQLPRRSPRESMVAQVAAQVRGVTVGRDGSLSIDVDALDPDADEPLPFSPDAHTGLFAFLAAAAGRTTPVKLQITGPVTLAFALHSGGAPRPLALAAAASGVRAYATALLSLVRSRLPEAPLLVFMDEPRLARTSAGSSGEVEMEQVVDHLSSVLAVIEEHAITGVHCCANTDWNLASAAGATVLAMPVEHEWVLANADAINRHLDRGGWIAWGVVPTHEPLGSDADRLWRRLAATWCDLVQAGCDPIQLRRQALVTPACGLAGHGVSQARQALSLASSVAERVTDQAVATRLSAGA